MPEAVTTCGSRRGTYAGAMAHTKAREPQCPACARAHAEYARARRARLGEVKRTSVSNPLLRALLREAPDDLRRRAVSEFGEPLLREWAVLPAPAEAVSHG